HGFVARMMVRRNGEIGREFQAHGEVDGLGRIALDHHDLRSFRKPDGGAVHPLAAALALGIGRYRDDQCCDWNEKQTAHNALPEFPHPRAAAVSMSCGGSPLPLMGRASETSGTCGRRSSDRRSYR